MNHMPIKSWKGGSTKTSLWGSIFHSCARTFRVRSPRAPPPSLWQRCRSWSRPVWNAWPMRWWSILDPWNLGRKGLAGWIGYGSIPINTIFSGMNIHLPAILMWTTGVQGFDTLPYYCGCNLQYEICHMYYDICTFLCICLEYIHVYVYAYADVFFWGWQKMRTWEF